MSVVFRTENVSYLPLPNFVEVVVSDQSCDPVLTRTAFMIPVHPDGSIVLAQNRRRGVEIAGGHVEPGETLVEAATREALEEVGCTVADVRPIGFLRMVSSGEVPNDYPYPHPLSYQQFFAGRVVEQHKYVVNDECGLPYRTLDFDGLRPSIGIFGARARELYQ